MATKLRRSNFHTDADNHVNESINAKLATNLGNISTGNITTTGYIAGPATFTIDPAAVGDNTGTLIVAGNLQVDGTTTTINSTTMEVDDLNITLASGAANATAANGAGITVDGASATITYASASDAWSFNKNVGIGTTSPVQKLDVAGGNIAVTSADTYQTTVNIDNTDTGGRQFGLHSTGSNNVAGAFRIYDYDANQERLRIDSNGNLLVGTSVRVDSSKFQIEGAKTFSGGIPQNQLNISDSTAVATGVGGSIAFSGNYSGSNKTTYGSIEGYKDNATAGHYGGSLVFKTRANGANNTERLRIDSNGNLLCSTGDIYLNSLSAGSSTYLAYSGGNPILMNTVNGSLRFGTNNTERMRIDNIGNLLVGTTSVVANSKLNVVQGVVASNDGAVNPYFQTYNSDAGTDLKYWRFGGQDDGKFLFQTVNDAYSSATTRLTIDSSGRVGIGTAPAGGVQLDVRGTGVLQLVNTDTVQLLASSGGSILKNVSNNPLLFGTNNTERMRILSTGDIAFGNTAANLVSNTSTQGGGGYVTSDKHFEFATNSNRSAVEIGKNNANDGQLVVFRKQGNVVGSVSVTSSGTTYNTSSDIRLKIDILPIADATDKLMAMNAVTHKWKNDPDADSIHGFIAQEMRDIVPEAVSQGQEENDTWSMDYGRITPIIVAALQDALKEIDMLKNRITELEAK